MTTTKFLVVGSIIGLFGAASTLSFHAAAPPPLPPHELHGVRIEPNVVAPGPDGYVNMVVYTEAIRRKGCKATVMRLVANSDGDVVYFTMAGASRVPPDGKKTEFPVHIRIKADKVPDGQYLYQNVVINKDCPGLAEAIIVPGDSATFEVKR
jgi:hypothetical protein